MSQRVGDAEQDGLRQSMARVSAPQALRWATRALNSAVELTCGNG